jgi:hypothetical protein
LSCQSTFSHPFTSANNLFITDAASQYTSPCNFSTLVTELKLSNSAATTNGYTPVNGYAPTSGASPTVGAGTNERAYCSVLLASNDPFIQAAGTACQSGTTFAVAYDSVNHKVIAGPAQPPTTRPASGAWDVGAFQYSGTKIGGPNPPGGLSGTGH